ncbi:disks large-associated protein 5 isoform 2-T2 [Acanthopagrus schlegelii]
MESRFSHLRQRDTSVSMLRVKLSRRRSQSQKENRERAVNTRRHLDKLVELEISSLDASIAMANMSTIHEKTMNSTKLDKKMALEERMKQLERWKERKALEKEKERREKERKGIFKTGVYHPKDTLIIVPAASNRAKETKVNTAPSQSTRVTRSMKQQQQAQRPLKIQDPNTAAKKAQPAVERSTRSRAAPVKPAPAPAPASAKTKSKVCAVEPVVKPLSTRSANKPPVTTARVVKDKPKDKPADVRPTRSRAFINAPSSDEDRKCEETDNFVQPAEPKEPEPDPVEVPTSFAPQGFIFQAPTGLSSFKFEPLTPRSADAFLTPSPTFCVPAAPVFDTDPQAESSEPSPPKSPRCSPPRTSPTVAPPTPGSPQEPKHDVPYFRSEIANETDGLTSLCVIWESKVEDESIPEEMRDRMRTAVGQARLLMKERFKQFSGLVDDCELGRGEKITTCTDLQGFWDMVYYQVEDVNKKFNALKEAESRGWVEEHKPLLRQKKVVKKPSAAPAKPTGTKGAAKSRLAAAKAAMKARQQAAEAEKTETDAGTDKDDTSPSSQELQPCAELRATDSVVFDGGFFQVESPARPSGTVRRSTRLSAAVLPQASPCSNYLSPRRVTRRSLALAQTPVNTAAASPAPPRQTPAQLRLTLNQTPGQAPKSQRGTPQSSQQRKDTINVSLCFSPEKEVLSDNSQPEGSPARQSATAPEMSIATPVQSLPSISVVEEQDEDLSPRLSPTPCKMSLPVSQAPELTACLSFTLSPCVTPSQPPISSPPAVQCPAKTQESVCHTPDSSVVEELPGLDFERYLQPSQSCSLSPMGEPVAMETLSPMAVDVEMESPRALPALSSVFTLQSPQAQTADSALLLFTPDMKDRIRQSVCPSDLMVFTPPL